MCAVKAKETTENKESTQLKKWNGIIKILNPKEVRWKKREQKIDKMKRKQTGKLQIQI